MSTTKVDMRLEVQIIPVSDVDRSELGVRARHAAPAAGLGDQQAQSAGGT